MGHLPERRKAEAFFRSFFSSAEERPVSKAPTAIDKRIRKQVSSGVLGDFNHHTFVHRDAFREFFDQFGFPIFCLLLVAAES